MMRRASVSGPFGSSIAVLTAALLAVGAPFTQGASVAPQPDAAVLSVTTDPAGATVYVDGRSRGVTPLEVTLTPGEHRVLVEKEGYLENSRMVTMEAGQARPVRVNLTSHRAQVEDQPRPQPTPTPGPETGGGGKKWLFIGLGAAAVGGTAFYFLTKNGPPTPGTATFSPTGTGMAGITSFTFASQGASDPDGDSLTYSWNFGDGTTGTGQTTNKVFANPGTFSVQLTINDGQDHSVNAPPVSVTVARNMSGTWTGGVHPGFNNTTISINLTQSGTTLSGSITYAGGVSGFASGVTGTLGGTTYPTSVTWSTPSIALGGGATVRDTFTGNTNGTGTNMTGTYTATLGAGFIWIATNTPTATRSNTFSR